MPRLAELIEYPRQLPAGLHNAISDVPGVAVGHTTVIEGDGEWQPGRGPFRTGVTLILPHTGNLYENKVPAAVYTINGFGKPFGFEQTRELGNMETPIALTGTLNVPRVADALISLAIEDNGYIGVGFAESVREGYASVNPVVGETNDGYLSDLHGRPVGQVEVRAALADARASGSGPVAEGSVGAGTGTSCYGWKGGIGTASRLLELPGVAEPFTVGALVQSNFGRPEELTILGIPIGRHLRPPAGDGLQPAGSIMIILATDAPLDSRQLERLAHRAPFGLARTGSICHGGSGDFVIAFSTGLQIPDRPEALLADRPSLYEQPIMSAFSLAAMAGHIRHDMVAARRAALIDLLADGRPHRREELWEAVEAQLNRDCWGTRPAETLWRDLGALRAGGLRIAYTRRAGVEGYYLQHPPIARQMTHPGEAVDVAHVTVVRAMGVAQKNRQAFAAAAFALQQKRLLLAREHPEWEEAQVDASARRLVYGRHEVP